MLALSGAARRAAATEEQKICDHVSTHGKYDRHLAAETKTERHESHRFVVHRVVRLYPDRGQGCPAPEKSFCRKAGSVFRSRNPDRAQPEIELACADRSRAQQSVQRYPGKFAADPGCVLFRRADRALHGIRSPRAAIVFAAAPCLHLFEDRKSTRLNSSH